ncbi:cold-shock protein, partial [Acinetobacter rathckeae]|uniref:cold-shock protein n=2 Tax=Acinetobacter rathckeae TaxID=2605272 RepID=UPI0018A2DAAD
MRDQGRLVEWFDDQGYGFIQPKDTSKARVFLHIKDFAKRGPRPIVGCALEYTVAVDGKGRFAAKSVVYLNAQQTRSQSATFEQFPQTQSSKLDKMTIAILIYWLVLF